MFKIKLLLQASFLIFICLNARIEAVAEWNQCGGQGYTGPAQCDPGLQCISYSIWWSSCQRTSVIATLPTETAATVTTTSITTPSTETTVSSLFTTPAWIFTTPAGLAEISIDTTAPVTASPVTESPVTASPVTTSPVTASPATAATVTTAVAVTTAATVTTASMIITSTVIASKALGLGDQCGGQGYNSAGAVCGPGLECRGTVWWMSCQTLTVTSITTSSAVPLTLSTPISVVTTASFKALAAGDQCGGMGYTGTTTCPKGLQCVGTVWWMSCQVANNLQATFGKNVIYNGRALNAGEQCGGQGYNSAGAVCGPGLECRGTVWWMSCQVSTNNFASNSWSNSWSNNNGRVLTAGDQCGGQGYTGSNVCAQGLTCRGTIWWMSCQI